MLNVWAHQQAAAAAVLGKWTPDRLGSKLVAFWDAEDASTLELSGSAVTAWTDKKNGNRCAVNISGFKPVFSPNNFNGRPSLVYDGIDDYLTLTGSGINLPFSGQAREIWAAVSQDAPEDTDAIQRVVTRCGIASTSRFRLARARLGNVSRGRVTCGNGASEAVQTNVQTAFAGISVVRGVITDADISAVVNKIADAPLANIPALTTTPIYLGAENTSIGFWQGKVNALIYTDPLTADEAAKMYQFMTERTGIAL